MALAANRQLQEKDVHGYLSIPVEEAVVIYQGALVALNAAGYAIPAAAAANTQFAGVAVEKADNTDGADGAISVKVARKGMFLLPINGSITQANQGDVVFADDDEEVGILGTAANRQKVGVVAKFVSSTTVWVDIDDGTANPALSGS